VNQQLKLFRVRVGASCPSSSEFLRVGAGNIKRTWKREEVYVPFRSPFGVRESSQGCDGGIGKGREEKKKRGARVWATKLCLHIAMAADMENGSVLAPTATTDFKDAAVATAAVANGPGDLVNKKPSENGGRQNGEIGINGGGGGGGGDQLEVAATKKVRDAEGRRRRRKQKKKLKDAAAGKREDSAADNDSDKEDAAAVEV
jgi:hypothetical protein